MINRVKLKWLFILKWLGIGLLCVHSTLIRQSVCLSNNIFSMHIHIFLISLYNLSQMRTSTFWLCSSAGRMESSPKEASSSAWALSLSSLCTLCVSSRLQTSESKSPSASTSWRSSVTTTTRSTSAPPILCSSNTSIYNPRPFNAFIVAYGYSTDFMFLFQKQ